MDEKRNSDGIDFSTPNTFLGFHLRLAQSKLFQHFQLRLAEFDITPGQSGLLMLIRDNSGVSQSALARAVGVERATLGQSVDVLVKRKLVFRARNDSDQRANAVRLTDAGQEYVDRLIPAIRAHEAEFASNLSKQDFGHLHKLLAQFGETEFLQ